VKVWTIRYSSSLPAGRTGTFRQASRHLLAASADQSRSRAATPRQTVRVNAAVVAGGGPTRRRPSRRAAPEWPQIDTLKVYDDGSKEDVPAT